MTRRWTTGMAAAVLWAVAMLVAACGDGLTEAPVIPVHTMEVSPAGPVALAVGDTIRLKAHPRAADGTELGSLEVAWSTESAQVAVRRNGQVHDCTTAFVCYCLPNPTSLHYSGIQL